MTPTDHYAAAIGRAVFAFASLEWAAVRACEVLRPGSMEDLTERTAGRVGDTLVSLAGDLPAGAVRDALHDAARDFRGLVATRNNLVHSRTGTDADGAAKLFRHGDPWTIDELTHVTALFADCEARLERALD